MAKATSSRFALLALESSDEEGNAPTQTSKKQADTKTSQAQKKKLAAAEQKKREKAELAALAFGGKKSKSSKKQAAAPSVNGNGFDDWKKKDEEFVEDSYQKQLEQALLASKLDFEEKGKVDEKDSKKKKKASKMTIGEFQSLLPSQLDNLGASEPLLPKANGHTNLDEDIFEKAKKDAKKIVKEEARRIEDKANEPFIATSARVAQLEEEVRLRDEEIKSQKAEVERLQGELVKSKSKIKKLCTIIGQSETREKAEILAHSEKVEREKEELVLEVTRLSKELEQERSKVSALSGSDSKKVGSKK